jgi:transcriptional antiterminator NusG
VELATKTHWFALRIIAGQERKVVKHIEKNIKRLGLEHLIVKVHIPLEKVWELRGGKKTAVERSFLPGYVFVEAVTYMSRDGERVTLSPEIIQSFKDIQGVIGFLGGEKGNQPMPLREAEVAKILGKMESLAQVADESAINIGFRIGEIVKVVDGPFDGFSGTVEEVSEDRKKLKVMVTIFGRMTPLELDYTQVERLD